MASGGKREGAGRKPFRTQSAVFNSRIEKGVPDALKREAHRNKEARRNKWNLSREIEMRLEASLVDVSSKDRWGSTQNYALGRLIGELARFATDAR